jgi:hypothetical protein
MALNCKDNSWMDITFFGLKAGFGEKNITSRPYGDIVGK